MSRPDGGASPAGAPAGRPVARPSGTPGASSAGPLRRWLPLALPASAVGAALLARAAPAAVEEWYARGAYPALAELVARAARAWAGVAGAPVDGGSLTAPRASLGEVTVALAGIALVAALVVAVRRRGVVGLARVVGLALGAILWLFLGLWGFNYAREPLRDTLGLQVRPASSDELRAAAVELARELSHDLDDLAGPAGAAHAGGGVERIRGALESALSGLGAATAWTAAISEDPALGWTRRPVLVAPLASRWLSAAGISGVFGPFTQECHVAAGLPALDRGFVACHEVAHAQGWAREDEANYLAYRVGVRHGDAALRVSGRAAALRHVLGALRRADRVAFEEVLADLDPRALELFEARRRVVLELRVEAVASAAQGVNDAYLRGNGQDGVASYGRMVDLILAERR